MRADSETVDFEAEANIVRKMSRSMSGVLSADGHMLRPSDEYVQRLKQRLYSPQQRHSVSKVCLAAMVATEFGRGGEAAVRGCGWLLLSAPALYDNDKRSPAAIEYEEESKMAWRIANFPGGFVSARDQNKECAVAR